MAQALAKLQGQLTSCASSIAQRAAITALQLPEEIAEEVRVGRTDQTENANLNVVLALSSLLHPTLNTHAP